MNNILKSKIMTLSAIGGLTVLLISFQNCSKYQYSATDMEKLSGNNGSLNAENSPDDPFQIPTDIIDEPVVVGVPPINDDPTVVQPGGTPIVVTPSSGDPTVVVQPGGTPVVVTPSSGDPTAVVQPGGTPVVVTPSSGDPTVVVQPGGTPVVVTPSSGDPTVVVQPGGTPVVVTPSSGDPTVVAQPVNDSPVVPPSNPSIGLGAGKLNVLILDPASTGSLSLSGHASLSAAGIVSVNSNNNSAAKLSGAAVVQAGQFNVVGNYQTSGAAQIASAIKIGAEISIDPLASLVAPSTENLATFAGKQISGNSVATLDPGVYTEAVHVSGASSILLNPGVYVFQKGLNISGGSTIKGNNVLIYIAGGSINFSGSSSITLSPQVTGSYAGITIFQARNNSSTASLSGSSNGSFEGTIYFPKAPLQISGGSNVPQPISVIAFRLQLSGGSFILGQ